MMRRLSILAGIAVAVFLTLAILALVVVDRFDGPGPLQADTVIYIARGTSMGDIARQLEADGAIEDSLVFRLGVRLMRVSRDLKAGEYLFPATVSMRGVVDVLLSGKTVLHRLTLPEGITSGEAAAAIEAAAALVGSLNKIPAEGSLLPETYSYSRGDTRAGLVERMQAAMARTLTELWEKRTADTPLKTPEEALILASIVEKETGLPDERPLVASVFINRLRAGMRLQSDPTVTYGITQGAPLGRALTRTDLQTDSEYNTYTNGGLPAGPIANPGRAAIEAVLNPAQSDFLYFVAAGNGGHAFAKTLDEHNSNVAKWRKLKSQAN
jgi:peptidoglycan lytic transglycosylase G